MDTLFRKPPCPARTFELDIGGGGNAEAGQGDINCLPGDPARIGLCFGVLGRVHARR
jgi:hypothetical protein